MPCRLSMYRNKGGYWWKFSLSPSPLSPQVSGLVSSGKRPPSLTAVIVGDDKASHIYVGNKMKAAEKCGLHANIIQRDSSLTQEELLEILDNLKRDEKVRPYRCRMDGEPLNLPSLSLALSLPFSLPPSLLPPSLPPCLLPSLPGRWYPCPTTSPSPHPREDHLQCSPTK